MEFFSDTFNAILLDSLDGVESFHFFFIRCLHCEFILFLFYHEYIA